MQNSSYQKLKAIFEEIYYLNSLDTLAQWDSKVTMPKNGAKAKAEQLAVLTRIIDEKYQNPELPQLLDEASADANLNEHEKRNLELMRQRYTMVTAMGPQLNESLNRQSLSTYHAWVEAKENDDFRSVSGKLKDLIGLQRQAAQALQEAFAKEDLYDGALARFSVDLNNRDIQSDFQTLKEFLVPFIQENKTDANLEFKGEFLMEKQMKLSWDLAKDMGISEDRFRIDISSHPFCCGDREDNRITTRFNLKDPTEGIFATIHESGHGLYNAGLPAEDAGQPIGEFVSFAVHESQSLFWERNIGLSASYRQYLLPKLRKYFGDQITDRELRAYYQSIQPSFIRVCADEVTYHMHIILRYELEYDLLHNKISVDDLPEIWNKKMKEYLGIVPKDDRQGCLQDIHWYAGYYGYFPSYSYGAMIAAQLMQACKKQIPDMEGKIARGEFLEIKDWCNRNIHRFGRRYETQDLIAQATGKSLDVNIFKNHLQQRYGHMPLDMAQSV